jgi:hypothetical protein
MSTDAEILSFLKSESSRLSNYLPASKIITSRIKKWERHLDNVLNSLLLDDDDKTVATKGLYGSFNRCLSESKQAISETYNAQHACLQPKVTTFKSSFACTNYF